MKWQSLRWGTMNAAEIYLYLLTELFNLRRAQLALLLNPRCVMLLILPNPASVEIARRSGGVPEVRRANQPVRICSVHG